MRKDFTEDSGNGNMCISSLARRLPRRKNTHERHWVDVHKCLRRGIQFYKAPNEVLLSPGQDGWIPTSFIYQVQVARNGRTVEPTTGQHLPSVGEVREALRATTGKRSPRRGKNRARKHQSRPCPCACVGNRPARECKIVLADGVLVGATQLVPMLAVCIMLMHQLALLRSTVTSPIMHRQKDRINAHACAQQGCCIEAQCHAESWHTSTQVLSHSSSEQGCPQPRKTP